MATAGYMTDEGIAKAKPNAKGDRWLTDKVGERNAGRLSLRISPKGVKRFYFRYSVPGRDRILISLDVYSAKPIGGAMTLEQARNRAIELRAIHKGDDSRDVKEHFRRQDETKRAVEAAQRDRMEQEIAAVAAARVYNVRALAAIYVAYLQRGGKVRSAQDAGNIFKNHLNRSVLADKPAKDVHPKEVTALLRSLVEVGKGRTAAKLRSYLRAAYALAIKSDVDASAPSAFIGFELESNPVAPVGALSEFTTARGRYLAESELAEYWLRLDGVKSESIKGALKLALLLGGQRPSQLLRLRRADVDVSGGYLTLHDPKGARTQARIHELPITPQALRILEPLVERAEALDSDWIFTSEGKAAIFPDTLTAAARDIAKVMKKDKVSPDVFKLSDLRRTIETMLAGMGVSRDVRAQIQSHGLGGVQQRHYDKHDYRIEKRKALVSLARRLAEGPRIAKVIPLQRRAKR